MPQKGFHCSFVPQAGLSSSTTQAHMANSHIRLTAELVSHPHLNIVPQKGFEPPTPGSEDLRSVH